MQKPQENEENHTSVAYLSIQSDTLAMRKALVVVCYQNDHVIGNLGSRFAKMIEKNIVAKIEEALDYNDEIFFIMDSFEEGFFKTAEGKRYRIKHCLRGSKGAELYGKVGDYLSKAHVIVKKTYGSDGLYSSIKGFDEIDICGVETHLSVLANVIIARTANPSAEITVSRNAVAAKDSEMAEQALTIMESMGIKVI